MKNKYFKKTLLQMNLMLFGALFFSFSTLAQKPMQDRSFEISLEEDEKVVTVLKDNVRYDISTGTPVALYQLNMKVPKGSPESMAQYYLTKEYKSLGIPKSELQNLHHHATRTTLSGSVVRYRQFLNGFPVNKAEVTITISPKNVVVYVMSSYQANIDIATSTPNVSKEKAYQLAYDYLTVNSNVVHSSNNLMIYKNTKMTRLAHEVVISSTDPLGEWHVFIDANTEEIFKVVDMSFYYCGDHDDDKKCKSKNNHSGCTHKVANTTNKSNFVISSWAPL